MAGRFGVGDAVGDERHVVLAEAVVLVGGVETDHQPTAAAVDDVLGLAPVVVHRRHLIDAGDHRLLGVGPRARSGAVGGAVSEGEQEQAELIEPFLPEIGHVPSQAPIENLANPLRVLRPRVGSPMGERREEEPVAIEEADRVHDARVDLGASHGATSPLSPPVTAVRSRRRYRRANAPRLHPAPGRASIPAALRRRSRRRDPPAGRSSCRRTRRPERRTA